MATTECGLSLAPSFQELPQHAGTVFQGPGPMVKSWIRGECSHEKEQNPRNLSHSTMLCHSWSNTFRMQLRTNSPSSRKSKLSLQLAKSTSRWECRPFTSLAGTALFGPDDLMTVAIELVARKGGKAESWRDTCGLTRLRPLHFVKELRIQSFLGLSYLFKS